MGISKAFCTNTRDFFVAIYSINRDGAACEQGKLSLIPPVNHAIMRIRKDTRKKCDKRWEVHMAGEEMEGRAYVC